MINPQAGIAARLERTAIVWQLLDSRAPMAVRRAVMPFAARVSGAITSWGRGLAAAHPGALAAGERLIVVYPPVDPALAPDAGAGERARERLGIAPGAVAIGTVGVAHSQKGHEHFVRAAAIVKREHPDAVFRVIGDPSPNHADHMASVEAEARSAGLLGPDGVEFVVAGRRGNPTASGTRRLRDDLDPALRGHADGDPRGDGVREAGRLDRRSARSTSSSTRA